MSTMPVRVAVLGSTRGSDLQPIIDALEAKSLTGIEIPLVLSNVEDSGILARAKRHGLNAVFLNPKGVKRVDYDAQVSDLLEGHAVDLVLLIGYMKLMSEGFVERWRNRVMNIHPSLLPAFAGGIDLNVHEAVLERGCKLTGASLIFIDEGADTGPIISQEALPVLNDDTVDTLKAKVQAAEGRLLIQALEWWRDGRISVKGTRVFIE